MIRAKSVAVLILLMSLVGIVGAENQAPPVPKGFPSEAKMKTAAVLGMMELVDAKNIAVPENITEHLGVEYCNLDGRSLQLDLYIPDSDRPTPAILFIHGGAWSKGKREDMKYYAVYFAKLGYAAATASYRLSTEAAFPAAVQDVKSAMRWMRANAKQYNIDADRIAASGNSAGGHLSMMLGYSSSDGSLEGECGNLKFSSKPQAVINFYGPVDLTGEDAVDNGSVVQFMAGRIEDVKANYQQASPLTHITKDAPPTLIFHGTVDDVVNVSHGDRAAEKLKSVGVDVIYERYDGWGHVMDLSAEVNKRCVYMMERFLAKHLK